MSTDKNGELLTELLNEQNYIQKLKLRATKQHRRVKINVTETFDSLIRSLKDRRTSLLNTLTQISEEIESQLAFIETAINNDVTRLQELIQEGDNDDVDISKEIDVYQSIHMNNQKRSLTRQAAEIAFQIDPHFIAELPIVGCIRRSQSVLASGSISKIGFGDISEQIRLTPGTDNNFYLLDSKSKLIHLISHEGELLHTVALHRSIRLSPINQFYTHKDKFYVTSRHDGTLKVFFKNGQLEHSLSHIGSQLLSDPFGIGHTSLDQLVIANTARHCLLLCQQDLSTAVALAEHSYQPHTLLPSPKSLAVDGNDCIYTISSQVNKLFVLSLSGEILCEMAIGELPHPIKSMNLTPTGDILIHTSSHTKCVGAAGSAICILKPGHGLVERLHLKGLTRIRMTDLCVTNGGVMVMSPEASTQLMLLRGFA
ncbi:hypothetical protein LOD99_8336 [Oopsacas minuta]|uniref:Uncharacterized protein n=1 Tax=Oopsacas minuta TaxID=111878 RepID=A0AAV7JHR1_9METZ|nr:hypothetical protein LOD99_8336 [Oopsacas minuta]